MHLTTTRENILPSVTLIGNVVERRQTLPILSNMLLKISGGTLILTATDLEVEIMTYVIVEADGEGEFTIPAKKFIDICRSLPELSEIQVKVSGEKVIVSSAKSKFTLGLLPATDYPSIEFDSPKFTIVFEESEIKRLIDKTAFSMAHQDVRYYLNGMMLEFLDGTVNAVATDGHRLAMTQCEIGDQEIAAGQYLLPRKAVGELSRMLDYTDEKITVEFADNLMRFKIRNSIFTSKLIDGKFPDYNRVIPKLCDKKASIGRVLLKDAISRTSILSSDKYKGIRLTFDKGLLFIQAHNPEQEEAEEEVEMEYEEEQLTIGFNAGYIIDILNSMSSDNVVLELSNSDNSALVKDPADSRSLYVLMPMRL